MIRVLISLVIDTTFFDWKNQLDYAIIYGCWIKETYTLDHII